MPNHRLRKVRKQTLSRIKARKARVKGIIYKLQKIKKIFLNIPERSWRKECFLYRELHPTFQRNWTRKMVG